MKRHYLEGEPTNALDLPLADELSTAAFQKLRENYADRLPEQIADLAEHVDPAEAKQFIPDGAIPCRVVNAIPPAEVIEKMCKGKSPYCTLEDEPKPIKFREFT